MSISTPSNTSATSNTSSTVSATDFIVLEETTGLRLSAAVGQKLREGWKLHGPFMLKVAGQYTWYVQAMIFEA